MTTSSPAEIERELYEDRTVLRVLAMRRTLFLVPVADVPMIHAAASRAVAETERKRTIAMLTNAGIGPDPAALLEELEAAGLAAVRERGEATTAELRALDPRLGQKLTLAPGTRWRSDDQRLPESLLPSRAGRQDRPRPAARHLDRQPIPLEPDRALASRRDRRDAVDEARAELVRRWLRVFGPGTRDDIKWWTGWTVAATKRALAAVEAVEVDLDGGAHRLRPAR